MYEKVNPSHPDKVADRIAGAIVDLAYSKEENPKIAVEVLLGHRECNIIVEGSAPVSVTEINDIVHRIAGKRIRTRCHLAAQDPHLAANQDGAIRCGDNGIFKGCFPTYEQRKLTELAGEIYRRFPTDGKYILDARVAEAKYPHYFTICQSHATEAEIRELINTLWSSDAVAKRWSVVNGQWKINPLGEWTGGPDVDCGATNRKLGSDMGDGVTGGGLHGKDLSKADVSVNIWCYLESVRTGRFVSAFCSIGDETVNGIPYADIVAQARDYINSLGGFEKFAEWGLIRPKGV